MRVAFSPVSAGTARLVRVALVAVLAVLALSQPAPAHAAGAPVANDTMIRNVYPLGRDLVYRRGTVPSSPQRTWMRRVGGRLLPARGIPRQGALGGDIGRDRRGRTVFTFPIPQPNSGAGFARSRWFVYDLASDRARPIRGLPERDGCFVNHVSLWRSRMAYEAHCDKESKSGLFLRQGRHTQRLLKSPELEALVLRGGTLAGIAQDVFGDYSVAQYTRRGKRCLRYADASFGRGEGPFLPTGLWIANGHLTWAMGHPDSFPGFAILSAKLTGGCGKPRPVGLLALSPEPGPGTVDALAVEGRRLFYSDGTALRSHTLPASPSLDPPANDDFDHAAPLTADAPFTVSGRIGSATVQPGEPLADSKHTVWYAYRPKTSGTVYVTAGGGCAQRADLCGNQGKYGVYTGTRVDALTPIPTLPGRPRWTEVDAVAGETYWISVATFLPAPNYEPFLVKVLLTPFD
jgi:hypothetical protein